MAGLRTLQIIGVALAMGCQTKPLSSTASVPHIDKEQTLAVWNQLREISSVVRHISDHEPKASSFEETKKDLEKGRQTLVECATAVSKLPVKGIPQELATLASEYCELVIGSRDVCNEVLSFLDEGSSRKQQIDDQDKPTARNYYNALMWWARHLDDHEKTPIEEQRGQLLTWAEERQAHLEKTEQELRTQSARLQQKANTLRIQLASELHTEVPAWLIQ